MISVAIIAVIIVIIVIGGIVAVVLGVRKASRPKPGQPASAAQPIVRRLIVYVLLFVLVSIAAIGVAGLLGRVFDAGVQLVAADTAGLARSLTFTLIGGPIAAVLWWVVWRRAAEPAERASVAWGLYLAAMTAVSLVTFVSALLVTVTSLIGENWERHSLANALVWAGVWVWHRWMLRHSTRSPRLLVTVPAVVGSVFGLVIGVGGLVFALGTLLDTAIRGLDEAAAVGYPWWRVVLQAAAWAVAGALVWWWHWFRDGARLLRNGLANLALVLFGILGAMLLALGGAGVALFVLLRLAFDRAESSAEFLDPLGAALASAAVGALVWAYHRGAARDRSTATRAGVRLVTSGIALVAAVSGIGVIINSLLATITPSLAGSDPRTLLLGGISALVVGAPPWWLAWRPTAPVPTEEATSTGRRVYLIIVFGVSAVVALVALLVVGSRVFEFLLDPAAAGTLVERVRAPLGLLIATALAFAYHFSVWRRDRAATADRAVPRPRTIGQVVLVAGGDAAPLAQAITELTGAGVTTWLRAEPELGASPLGAGPLGTGPLSTTPGGTSPLGASPLGASPLGTTPGGASEAGPDLARLAEALVGLSANRVLVVAGPGDRVEVIPLRD